MKKKWLVNPTTLVIVILFICVSFQPILATNTFQNEKSDLVKVVVQTCNVHCGQNYTKYLTQEQVQQLKNLFGIIYKKLDDNANPGDANEIFREGVVSIDELGLLPNDMTVEDAFKFILSGGVMS